MKDNNFEKFLVNIIFISYLLPCQEIIKKCLQSYVSKITKCNQTRKIVSGEQTMKLYANVTGAATGFEKVEALRILSRAKLFLAPTSNSGAQPQSGK